MWARSYNWGTDGWIFWRYIGAKHQEDGFWIWSGYVNRKTGVGKHWLSVFPFSIPRSFLFDIFAGVNLHYWHQKMHGTLARSIDTKPSRQVLPPKKWGPPKKWKPDPMNQPTLHFQVRTGFFLFQGRYIGYPWNKSLNGLFSLLNLVIPKSLKFGQWPSICFWFGSVRKTTSFSPHVTGFRTPMHPGVHQRLSRCRIFKVNQQNVSIFPRMHRLTDWCVYRSILSNNPWPVGI